MNKDVHFRTTTHGGTEGVAEKQMADTYEKAVAVEGTENATGNSSEVRRFFGA